MTVEIKGNKMNKIWLFWWHKYTKSFNMFVMGDSK